MFKKVIFLSIFITSLFANDFTPQEQCSYESEEFWIKILYLCPEGDLGCNKMVYVGVNKDSGDYIVLKGKTLLDGKQNFKGYSFKNGAYEYSVFRNNILQISKNNSILQEIKLRDCQ